MAWSPERVLFCFISQSIHRHHGVSALCHQCEHLEQVQVSHKKGWPCNLHHPLLQQYSRAQIPVKGSVNPPSSIAWLQLMDYGDPSSFLLTTGLTREAFNSLNDIVLPPGHQSLGNKKGVSGHCPLMPSWVCYLQCKHLCMLFGIMPSACSCILNNMLKIAVRRLCNHPSA